MSDNAVINVEFEVGDDGPYRSGELVIDTNPLCSEPCVELVLVERIKKRGTAKYVDWCTRIHVDVNEETRSLFASAFGLYTDREDTEVAELEA